MLNTMISKRQAILAAILVAVTLITSVSMSTNQGEFQMVDAASSDYFLKLEGVDGESQDDQHKGEIEILSWSWGATQQGSHGGGGGGGAGKASFQDLSITKRIDKTTPDLMLKSLQGQHIPQATLSVRKAGGGQQDYYVITLKDVMISSFAQAGDGSQETDTLKLSYQKIEFDLVTQSADGTTRPRHWGWDLKLNKKV